MLKRETDKLKILEGQYAPRLVASKDLLLVREYIDGQNLNSTSSPYRRDFLKQTFFAICAIHGRQVAIGDAHVKNLLLGEDYIRWLDLIPVIFSNSLNFRLSLYRKASKIFFFSIWSIFLRNDLNISITIFWYG